MLTLLVAVGSFLGFIVAYHTYGRWLGRSVFGLDRDAVVPSEELRDDVDYVPTKRGVIFGHHFTSIAGTGPIVGPAIAVFWGWLPALLWVVIGSIFIGAVHDFGALVVSLRNRGQTVGEVAGRMVTKRAKVLFLLILFFALTVVLAIFGLVIASIFKMYPETVISVWIAMPLAVAIGFWAHRGGELLVPSLLALAAVYGAIFLGIRYPVVIPESWGNPIVIWSAVLFVYCFFASVLPVWVLLQPRDYINSHQLIVALALLVGGMFVAGLSGEADLAGSAPAMAETAPAGAPPILPFLFITIACGAVSGFHCLVSSGTSSKQVACETDAQFVGYGAMLLEGALAVVVILACCAGLGMGRFEKSDAGVYVPVVSEAGEPLRGADAWEKTYDPNGSWGAFGLGAKVGAFVEGGANFLSALGIPLRVAIGIIAVLVACFAATTLDTATRLQRYVVQELAGTFRVRPLTNKYAATAFAAALALSLAMMRGPDLPDGTPRPHGTGGLFLWPLFGATNQLLAGLALLVTAFYLYRRNKPIWFLAVPTVLMIVLPAWALCWKLFNEDTGWFTKGDTLLASLGIVTLLLQAWMVVEAAIAWPRAKGVLEEALPPLAAGSTVAGRSC
ncbi:MAG: carbon starvation protein A [Planctomycetota bacterium]